jgi:hypothetical protein
MDGCKFAPDANVHPSSRLPTPHGSPASGPAKQKFNFVIAAFAIAVAAVVAWVLLRS